MKKKWKWVLTSIVIVILILFSCHLSPKWALRAHLLTQGYFKSGFTTGIVEDTIHNKQDKKSLEKQHAKCYTLTKPPMEWETRGILANWKVKKIGLLYFVSYYGDA